MYKDLKKERCIPCEEGRGHLMVDEINELLAKVPEWTWADHERLERTFKFKDFDEAFALVTKVSNLAEKEGHHPDIEFGWGYAKIKLMTHSVGGLTENDFIMAAKIDTLGSRH